MILVVVLALTCVLFQKSESVRAVRNLQRRVSLLEEVAVHTVTLKRVSVVIFCKLDVVSVIDAGVLMSAGVLTVDSVLQLPQ